MANQVYIVPLRNDLDGANIQVTDLRPNTSQRNLIYDGPGQSGYLKWSLDPAGLTTVDGDSYASGSTNTTPISALTADDTTGAGNDVSVPVTAEFGLEAYLRDRVNVNPGVDNDSMTPAEAGLVAADILAALQAGTAITLAVVNASLNANLAGADNDLEGTAGTSFGTIEDILRILRGEVYRVRGLSIVTDETGAWLGLTARQALVDAQTPADVADEGQFYASGDFLVPGEPGFRDVRPLLRTGAFNISNGEGVLAGLKDFIDFNNPNYAYTAADVTAIRPRAVTPDGTAVPEDGVALAVAIYDGDGNPL
jgi:hypothetical protein